MSVVIYVERWCRRAPATDRRAEVLAQDIRALEHDLRVAGYGIAGDLVAAAGIALWQKLQGQPDSA
jgi:hypothetical protein